MLTERAKGTFYETINLDGLIKSWFMLLCGVLSTTHLT
jgi:hypothetical protein